MRQFRALPHRFQFGVVFGLISVLSIMTAALLLVTESGATQGGRPGSAERGIQLFVNKGCIGCHGHERASNEVEGVQSRGTNQMRAYGAGDDLTDYQGDAGFLREWLADPSSIRPDTGMPDLNLDDGEIEALIAFLNESEDDS